MMQKMRLKKTQKNFLILEIKLLVIRVFEVGTFPLNKGQVKKDKVDREAEETNKKVDPTWIHRAVSESKRIDRYNR